MIFSKPKNPNSAAPERRVTLGTLLNPNFGAGLRPIAESTRVFINLIAMLFVMNGLFPKDHPAFVEGGNVRLSLGQVIGTAWSNLTFTEKDLPKTLFFFAVIGCMAMTGFVVVIGIFSLFISSAHAATTTNFFTPPTNDLAQNWIDYLFQGKALLTTYNQAGTSNIPNVTNIGNSGGSINIQCAMITALGFYSDAVLMVAALILFYHLAVMVVETAHHGQVMGKRGNQIWAPIRLVVAVGLLVPIGAGAAASSCPSGGSAGLNSAQYITIKIAELGSALASNAWDKFVTQLAGSSFTFIQPSTPAVNRVVEDIFLMEGCRAAWNWRLSETNASMGGLNAIYQINAPTPVTDTAVTTGQYWNFAPGTGGAPVVGMKNVCGYIFLPNPPLESTNDTAGDAPTAAIDPNSTTLIKRQQIANAHQAVLTEAITDIDNLVNTAGGSYGIPDMAYFVPTWNHTFSDGSPPDNQDFRNEVQKYATNLDTQLTAAFGASSNDLAEIANGMTTLGWIAAGVWMNTIARDQGAMVDAVYDGMPVTAKPNFTGTDRQSLISDTVDSLEQFHTWLNGSSTATDLSAAPSPCELQGATGNAGLLQQRPDAESTPIFELLHRVDKEAQKAGMWYDPNYTCTDPDNPNQNKLFTLGTQFNTANPFGELSSYGQKAMRVALWALNGMFGGMAFDTLSQGVSQFAKGVSEGRGGGPVSAWNAAAAAAAKVSEGVIIILAAVATVFFTIGVTLAYIVPLIPFVHFFFAALAWALVILEGVIAMPLVALAHLNPEGDGLPGGMAKQAYFMLLGLFLRPILIIFSFIASLLMFMLAMLLLNKLYAITVVGTGGMGTGYSTISRIIFTVIYVFLAYTCVTNCFKLVDSLPEAVFRWISINVQHQRIADGGSVLQSAAPLVTGYATQQGMQTLQGAGGKFAEAAGGVGQLAGNLVGGAIGPTKGGLKPK